MHKFSRKDGTEGIVEWSKDGSAVNACQPPCLTFSEEWCVTKAHTPCLHLKYSHRKHRREAEQRHHGRVYYYETGVLASACLCLLRTLGVPLVKRVVQSLLLSDEY